MDDYLLYSTLARESLYFCVVQRSSLQACSLCGGAMEFPFPPVPPGYSQVLTARAILIATVIVGAGIVVARIRRWKCVQPTEINWWGAAAAISCVVLVSFGVCHYPVYDNNRWNWPIFAATMSVSISGITICLTKIYIEGTAQEKRAWIGGMIGAGAAAWLLIFIVLFPALVHPREVSNRTQCKYNLKQIGLAMHNYHHAWKTFPPAVGSAPLVSWRVVLLPYLDQTAVYSRYDQKRAWNQTSNLLLAAERVDVWICPSNYKPKDANGLYCTAYSMLTGPRTIGGNPQGTTLLDITDGSSNTAMVVEACGAQITWSEPRDVNIEQQPIGINFNGQRPGHSASLLSAYHYGAHVLLVDGSVRWLPSNIEPTVLQKLLKIDDGEIPDDF